MIRKLLLFALLCACLAFTFEWETVTEGGFTAQMPATPTRQVQSIDTSSGKIDVTILAATKGGEAFLIGYNDVPASVAAAADPKTILDNARDGAVRKVNGKVTSEREISIEGHPGKEFTGDGAAPSKNGGKPDEGTFTERVYWVSPRLYQVLNVRPKGSALSDDAQKFLDSFKLVSK
jgi:hypothetical protein